VSGENGAETSRYTLGVGGRRPSIPTPVDDVFRHLSTCLTGRADGTRSVSDTGPILTVDATRTEVDMGSITPYESAKGRRCRVRYRKSRSHRGGEARLHDDARSETVPLHGDGVEVEG